MLAAWRLAVGTLTAIPVAAPGTLDRRTAGRAMALAPLATLLLSVTPLLASWAVGHGAPVLLAATLTLAAITLGTKGIHLDGLADTCDGLAVPFDRDRSLAVMRQGDLGPAGATALVLSLLLQTAALTVLLGSWPGAVAAAVAIASGRHTLVWSCRDGVPAARPEGLGAVVAGSVPSVVAAVSFAGLAGVCGGLVWWSGGAFLWGVLVCAVAVLAVLVLVARAQSRFGGVTGDVLGAGVELGTTTALVAACFVV